MQPNARLSSKSIHSEKPPTAWRTYSNPSVAKDSSFSRQERQDRTPNATSPNAEGVDLRVSPAKRPSFHCRTSSELSIQRHVTRDSMLDNILLSLNHMQDSDSPQSRQPPLYSSFQDGEFKLDTPRFVYDAITHMSSNSQSSSVSSSPYLKQQDSFGPTEIINTPTRRSSLAKQHNSDILQHSASRKTFTERPELERQTSFRAQALAASAPNTPPRKSPKNNNRKSVNSMDVGTRSPREPGRRHKSMKSDASTQPSPLPASAIISQPPNSMSPKKSSMTAAIEPPRERQGFLRRVFGSSRSRSQVRQQQPEQLLPVSAVPETIPTKKSADQLPTLNKKASFFRRKKRDPQEGESINYGVSYDPGPGSPISVPGLALTTDDHPLAASWGGPRLHSDEHAFEISYKQTYEPVIVKPAKRIWIQPDEYDRVVPAPIISTKPEVLIIEGPGSGTLPAPIRSSALSQALQSMYTPSVVSSQISIGAAVGQEDLYVDPPAPVDDFEDRLEDDRNIARRMFNGGEIDNSQSAILLGQQAPQGDRLRQAYMELYDFADLSVLSALRELCGRLALKAETQQVDRILTAFSQRWCHCNPNHEYRSHDVVHTICYSLFLLNTDLHVADHDHKMTKNQFIRNTLPTVRSMIDGKTTTMASVTHEDFSAVRPSSSSALDMKESRPSLDRGHSEGRLSVRPKLRPASGISSFTSPTSDTSISLVNATAENTMRAWENHIETILREFYNSIRQQRLPLSGTFETHTNDQSSIPSGSIRSSSMQRTSSVTSRDLLETPRSRVPRWTRSKGKPYSSSTINSSRQSSEDQNLFSPSGSSTWGRSYGKTLTPKSTMSLDGQMRPGTSTQTHSIGFANALGQAMVNHQEPQVGHEAVRLEDEVLQLAGAPWAKEGIVQHKHQLQATDKKNKDRHWTECFAVVEKGHMRLFSFTSKASVRSQRQKKGGVVGGGNWTESAESLENFVLMRTIAEVLPKGYGLSRPHAFTLTLPSGAVHIFQVGTLEISKEFVDTINYWSARYTPQPLSGGVSSIEYGWSEALLGSVPEPGQPRSSFQSSIRSGLEGVGSRSNTRARLPGDRVPLADWISPVAPMQPSTLPEGQQLTALMSYLEEIESETQTHSELRARLKSVYTPAQPNGTKAMANWERKSAYLQGECTRLMRYIDCLNAARLEEEKLRLSR